MSKQRTKWTPAKEKRLIKIVKSASDKKVGIKNAAAIFNTNENAVTLKYNRLTAAPAKSKSNLGPKKKGKFTFAIENDWQPKKVTDLDDYLMALVEHVKKLKPGQSTPLSVAELTKRYGWKSSQTCVNSLRYALAKKLAATFMGKLTFHEVKQDGAKTIDFVRIRHKNIA